MGVAVRFLAATRGLSASPPFGFNAISRGGPQPPKTPWLARLPPIPKASQQTMEIVCRRLDAAIGNPENPRRFRMLPKWAVDRPHSRAEATDGFFHGQLASWRPALRSAATLPGEGDTESSVPRSTRQEQLMTTPDEAYAAAETLKEAGKLEEAVAALEALVADHPDFALAHSGLSAWCTRLERHDKAVEHARRVCELEPNEPFSFTALSVACMKAGKIAEAEDALARARMMQG